jgi:hypothetical protein
MDDEVNYSKEGFLHPGNPIFRKFQWKESDGDGSETYIHHNKVINS